MISTANRGGDNMNYFYALYKGDTFIMIADTIQDIAAWLNVSVGTVRWMSYPSAHKRFEGKDAMLVYKYEE